MEIPAILTSIETFRKVEYQLSGRSRYKQKASILNDFFSTQRLS